MKPPYYLNSAAKADIRRGQTGIALTHFNTKSVAQLAVALPPTAEQEAIVDAVEDQLSIADHLESDIEARLRRSSQALRQAILRHAFSGKLVPQDPNDQPASELLKRIAADREERAREAAAQTRASRQPAKRGRPTATSAEGESQRGTMET